MVWRGISLQGCTDFHIISKGTLNWNLMFRVIARPFSGVVHPGFLLMQGSSWCHMARGCKQCLNAEGTDALDGTPVPLANSKLASIQHCLNIVLLCIDASSAFKYCYRQGAHYSVSERMSPQTPSAYLSEVYPDIVGRAYRHTGTIHTTVLDFSVSSCNKIAVNQPAF